MDNKVDPVVRVMAAVISRGDELLVCQRPLHKRHGGLWEFPGGKCEPGESDADALHREMREELGIKVVEVGQAQFESRDEGSPFVIVFVPVQVSGEPVCHEHEALRWGTAEELGKLPLAPSDRRFMTHLLERSRSEADSVVIQPGAKITRKRGIEEPSTRLGNQRARRPII